MIMQLNAYLEGQYDLRAQHPGHHKIKAYAHRRSEWVRSQLPLQPDLSCGTASAARFDVVPGRGVLVNQPAMIFIHGGFWRSGDKGECTFLAEPFYCQGIATVLLNYSLAPSVSLSEIIREVRSSFVAIVQQARQLGLDPGALVLGGHSAGGHLAAMIEMTDWSEYGFSQAPVQASFGISGLYDPRPLARTSFQHILALPADGGHLVALPSVALPGLDLVACGTLETDELRAQTRRYADAARNALDIDPLLWVDGRDHYAILNELADENSELFRRVLGLFKG